VALSVRDTGAGMSAETRAHLFEPFFTTKEKGKGTGLGLAMVYGIVQQAGGDVHVESELGVGTAFHVLLPRIEDAPSAAADGPRPSAVRGGTETLLLVEDDPQVRAAGVRALRGAGYTVLEAADGEEALAVAAEVTDLDAVVTDVVMPRLGGPAMAARLRAAGGPERVLFVSGYAEEGLLRRALGDEPAEILWKPFTTASLSRAVRDLLDGPAPPHEPAALPASPVPA
jgi:CheY-like chemotaxis protein